MDRTPLYPRADFVRDLAEWHASQISNGLDRAGILFSRHYPVQKVFAYRFNRFARAMGSVANQLHQLVQDGIVQVDAQGKKQIPQELLLALHEWYCGLDEPTMTTMPPPNWVEVMRIYDRIKSEASRG